MRSSRMLLDPSYVESFERYPLLSPQEEYDLGLRVQMGDSRACDKLVNHNLRLVMAVARRYQGRGLSFEDLIAEGNLGLYKASQKFNPEKARFSTYAFPAIKKTILNALISHYRKKIRTSYDGNPDRTFDERVSDPGARFDQSLSVRVGDLLGSLSERQREVVALRYGLCGGGTLTLRETGFALGISCERVRQLEEKAILNLGEILKGCQKDF